MQTYEIVFSGQVAPGADPMQARQGVQRLFNASEQLLEQFFSGRRIVIKRDLDQAAADKYLQAFARVGALVEVVATGQAAPIAATAAPVADTPVAVPTAQAEMPVSAAAPAQDGIGAAPDIAPRDEYMAAFSHVQAPNFGLAGVGVDLLENKPEQVVTEVDISGLSLAAPGSDLEQLPGAEPVTVPDISHLKLEQLDELP